MVVETDDKEERTDKTEETPMTDSALIGWLGAIHAEIRAMRVEMRELSARTSSLEQRVTRIEASIEVERERKNRLIMWLGIGIGALGALIGAGGVVVGVTGLLN